MSEPDADARLDQQRAVHDVPDFDLIRPIGSGGFGEVWLATNRTTRRLRAVKVIPLHAAGQADPAAREISSLTRLEANSRCRHPNLLQIHHVGKTATHLFYVMDPADDVSGEPASDKPDYRPATLQSKLEMKKGTEVEKGTGPICAKHPEGRSGKLDLSPFPPPEGRSGKLDLSPFPPELCLEYARQLLAGLASLHAAGMVHRDVKPANCLFVGGQLKLADFGLLTECHPLVSHVGTQKYMPPDGRMDMRADVYAAGLVIYEMLSGLPVDEFPRLGKQSKHISDSPILTALLRLVLRACERDSEKRPADARAMLAELAAPLSLAFQPRRRWLRVAIVAIALAAVAGMSAWMLQDNTKTDSGQIEGNRTVVSPVASDKAVVPTPPLLVEVSFVTDDPFEDKIYLDGALLCKPDKKPYTTPCTVKVPARTCRVAFQHDDEPRWEAEGSPYDLGRTQQIFSQRPRN